MIPCMYPPVIMKDMIDTTPAGNIFFDPMYRVPITYVKAPAITFLTYTNNAGVKLRQLYHQALKNQVSSPFKGPTFHSFSNYSAIDNLFSLPTPTVDARTGFVGSWLKTYSRTAADSPPASSDFWLPLFR